MIQQTYGIHTRFKVCLITIVFAKLHKQNLKIFNLCYYNITFQEYNKGLRSFSKVKIQYFCPMIYNNSSQNEKETVNDVYL